MQFHIKQRTFECNGRFIIDFTQYFHFLNTKRVTYQIISSINIVLAVFSGDSLDKYWPVQQQYGEEGQDTIHLQEESQRTN